MPKPPVLLTFIVFFSINSFGQQHAKSLLWKISGNGLTKPSYLFGTMHITNKEVFRFGDSVYHAIDKTDGLAIEVNPEEMAAHMVKEFMFKEEKGTRVSDVMEEKEFNKYKKSLSKKFNKNAEEITTEDILKEKNKWVREYMSKGEMQTFMDAFLYNIARKQGKWIGGIEDLADQTSLTDNLFDISDLDLIVKSDDEAEGKVDKSLKEMIRIYLSEDIDALFNYSSESDKVKDLMLVRRNIKMARRMDSLSALRPTFFAVGAAHLAGDSGVIRLLKKRGFEVSPVFSSKKLEPSQYKYKEVAIPWITVKEKNGLYSVNMPGNPTSVKMFGLLDTKMLMDLFTSTGYFTMNISSTKLGGNRDSLFQGLARNMFKDQKNIKSKDLNKDGIIGKEFSGIIESGFMRVQVWLHNKTAILNMVYSLKKNGPQEEADRFFNSFVLNKNAFAELPDTYAFQNEMVGVKVEGPGEWTYSEEYSNKTDETWDVESFTAIDINGGGYNFVMIKQPKVSRFIASDSALFRDLLTNMSQNFKNLELKDTTLNGHAAAWIRGDDINDDHLSLRILSSIRGNTNALLMTIAEKDYFNGESYINMVKSFQWTEPKKITWNLQTDSSSTFKTFAPGRFHFIRQDGEDFTYSTYDSAYSTSHSVTIAELGKYEWALSNDIFWKNKLKNFVGEKDSLIYMKDVENGKMKGKELMVRIGKTGTFERSRILLAGNKIITLYVSSSASMINSSNIDRLMKEFRYIKPVIEFSVTKNKLEPMLAALSSKDSATREDAMDHLKVAPITEKDLATIKKAFSRFSGDTEVQLLIIDAICKLRTEKSLLTSLELLRKNPVKEGINWEARNNLTDSTKLVIKHLGAFTALGDDEYQGPVIADLYLKLYDSSLVSREQLLQFEPLLLNCSKKQMYRWTNADSSFDYGSYAMVDLLSKIKSPATISMLKQMQAATYPYLKRKVALGLVRAGEVPEPAVIDSIMTNKYMRAYFYEELKKEGKQSLIPSRYLVQENFAYSYMLDIAEDDYEIESAELIETKDLNFAGKTMKFYLYKVIFNDGETQSQYLAIAGGFKPGSSDVDLVENYSILNYDEELTDDNLEDLVEGLLKQYNEE